MAGAKHKNRTSWEKGKSANPGGRSPRMGPNGESLTELCRAHTVDAIKALSEIMQQVTNEPKDRISAAVALLDRGWGKPKEAIDVEARVEGGLGLPVIQILRYDDPPGPTH
ncbi:hypothetical protein [Pseudoxanthomonas sp. PXM05]|uniref:hypothetical protein n=1 Tax=Pseudoxanthomonas sp. PXM05 TaxID=2854775 RepID=UPI001C467748|nr:hypothetical protein [Pseudoxanthomonas sp. PXM05]MBV7475384.1 hypothetical protein [Pseudoxanthomonas sp. PXM05]